MNNLQQIAHWFSNYSTPFNPKDLPLKFGAMSHDEILLQADFPIAYLKNIYQPKLDASFPDLKFTWSQQILPHLTQLPGLGIKNIKNIIAVVSGKGGVGKSTVASNLAAATALLGCKTGLLDADIYGPSLPTMMGISGKMELTEDQKYQPLINHQVECMSMGFLQNETPFIWRGPMLAKALLQLIDNTKFSELDYLFIDMPPGTGDIPLSLVQKIPLSGAIIVTTPQTIATMDAEKSLQMFLKTQVPILGIVSNMAWHECHHCHEKSHLFGDNGAKDLAARYHLPLLGEIPLTSIIREDGDSGTPNVLSHPKESPYWLDLTVQTLLALSKRPPNVAPKIPPIRSV